MPSFSVTTEPKALTLAPGSAEVIAVVVSNLQGKPVMVRADLTVTPPSAAGWFTLSGPGQRKLGADPSTTERFEYSVAVPATARSPVAQAVQFRVDAVDVLTPDDHFQQGEVVAITVPAEVTDTGGKIPWWVWVVAAVVVVGVGLGLYFGLRKTVPNVLGDSLVEAQRRLRARGFTVVTPTFQLDSSLALERDEVVEQTPAGGEPFGKEDTVATVTVKRRTVQVPEVVGKTIAEAATLIGQQGLTLPEPSVSYNSASRDDGKVASVAPPVGSLMAAGDTVKLVVFSRDAPCQPWPRCQLVVWQNWRVTVREGVLRTPP